MILATSTVALSQSADTPNATLVIDVQADHSETMTLTFDGLQRLTRYSSLCLPERARETRVYDEVGEVPYDAAEREGRRSISFLARSETIHVDMTRPAGSDVDHPLYTGDANFCVPSRSSVTVTVRVPEGHTLFFLSDGGTVTAREGTARSDGPTHVFYTYEAPLGSGRGVTLVEAAPFRVFVNTAHAAEAQEIASLAAAPFRAALDEAGLDTPFDALRVLYAKETPFSWEAGHYNGHGYVVVKESTLTPDPAEGYPISAVRVLVHEGFHAASFPRGRGDVEDAVAWWLEGTAKHAERQVDAAMPNATRHCEESATQVRCWDFDDRILRKDVDVGYVATFRFDTEWEPSVPQSEETRRFYYSYSEYAVGAWILQNGVPAYRSVWDDVTAAFDTGAGCPCDEGWLERLLDDHDGLLFRPWQTEKEQRPTEFEALVKPLVKDEEALQRELRERSDPLAGLGIPLPFWVALAAILLALSLRRT